MHNTKYQTELEKIISSFDPGNLYVQAEHEYEDEARMFLEQINDSMNEEQLLDIMHDVFKKMLCLSDDEETREKIRPIIKKYLHILNEVR